jgi:glycosyltransferase involved in cell wall biosynthesis
LNGIADPYKQVERLKKLGIKYVIDFDDYWILPKDHLLYGSYKHNNVPEMLIYLIKNADYVLTTHNYLAKKIKRYNKNVEIAPNAIDPEQPQFKSDLKIDAQSTIFGWCGGIHHWADLEILKTSLQRIHSEGGVNLALAGYVQESRIWNEYESWFDNGGKYQQYLRLSGKDVYNYGTLYDYFTTALIPLRNDEFNKCKSELKMIEAGFKRKAVIVSDVMPYTNLITVDNCIKVDNEKPQGWYKAIKRINESKALEEHLAGELYQSVVVKHHIKNANKVREQVFNSL